MWKEYIDAGKATMDDKTKRRANLVCHENPQEMIYVTDNMGQRTVVVNTDEKTYRDYGKYDWLEVWNVSRIRMDILWEMKYIMSLQMEQGI